MRLPKLPLGLFAAIAFSPALSQSVAIPNAPTLPLESKYYANGPWHARMMTIPGCVSKPVEGAASVPMNCEIYYPAELGLDQENRGTGGFRHPIVVWGNGTGAGLPGQYGYWFDHLVSWGFVVMRTSDPTALDAKTIVASADYLAAQDADPSSPFYGKLDLARIGAAGHSQGAAGALNAMTQSGGRISTAVSFDIPFNGACVVQCADQASLEAAKTGSVLYLTGSEDLISRDTQAFPGPLNSNTAFYDATPDGLTKAKAVLIGTNHDDIQGDPTCVQVCGNGVYGFMAYPTAWLMWRLRDVDDGRQVFRSGDGEIFRSSANWRSIRSNIG